jgi:hypothetical protein
MKPVKFPRRRPRAGAVLFLSGILVPALALVFFISRPPVLILSDAGFEALYGQRRILLRQAGLSLRFFRRVKRVSVAENAGPEAAVFAVEEAAAEPWIVEPWAVLGRSRYRPGLEQYAQLHPDVPVLLIAEDPPPDPGSFPDPAGPGLESVFIDTRLGSWRAGRCAALLAGEGPGGVLVFQEREDFPVNQEAFLAGLREENGTLIPLFLSGSVDYSSWAEVRCVVLGGPADYYFNRNSGIPALLFTWLDPALSPRTVKVTGDDSPWALAPEILRSPGGDSGGFRSVPAEFTVLPGRTEDKELRKRLKRAVHLQIPAGLF